MITEFLLLCVATHLGQGDAGDAGAPAAQEQGAEDLGLEQESALAAEDAQLVSPAPNQELTQRDGPRSLVERAVIEPLELHFDHAYDFAELSAALESIAARAPHLTTLKTIGHSSAGHPLQVLTLSDPRGGEPRDKPAILMLDFSASGSSCGAETALAFVQILLDAAARDAALEKAGEAPAEGFAGLRDVTQEELQSAMDAYGQDLGGFLRGSDPRQILRDFCVIIAPALDPDERMPSLAPEAGGRPASKVQYDLNFPLGWRPASLRPGSGHYPLSKPETLALASYLAELPNLALVLGIDSMARDASAGPENDPRPWPGAALPASDRGVFQKLGGIGYLSSASVARRGGGLRPSAILAPWGSFGSEGGGLFDYAFQRFGIYSVAWSPAPLSSDELVPEAELFANSVHAMALQSVTLLGALPRVRIEKDGLLELAPALWQLDVAVRNSGVLPTLSALGEMRRVPGDVRLTLNGAKLLATGLRAGDDAAFQVVQLETTGNMVSMGGAILDSGETRWLRLVLEGERGSSIELVGRAARGGVTRLGIRLE